jgi:hypothetical protein
MAAALDTLSAATCVKFVPQILDALPDAWRGTTVRVNFVVPYIHVWMCVYMCVYACASRSVFVRGRAARGLARHDGESSVLNLVYVFIYCVCFHACVHVSDTHEARCLACHRSATVTNI